MSKYTQVAKTPGVSRIMAAQLVARFPGGMYSLGVLMHIEQQHGSYGAAGLVLAAMSIGQGISGPVTSRWMGRFGTRRVLLATMIVCIAAILTIAVFPLPVWGAMIAGFIGGFAFPPVLPAVRTLYPKMVPQKLLTSLFSLDATLQEVIWVIGPVAVTFMATQVGTTEGLLLALAFQLLGTLWFTFSPEIGKLRIPLAKRKLGVVLRKRPVLLSMVAGLLLIGSCSAIEAGVVSLFGHGNANAGIILGIYAIGSFAGGLSFGHLPVRRHSLGLRLVLVLFGTALSAFLLDFWGLALALFIAGLGIAPALAAMSSIVAGTVKFSDTAEAYGWVGTGQLIGAATGSAIAGFSIDAFGAAGAMWTAIVYVALAAAVALVFRKHQPDLRHGIESPADTGPMELAR
ncbi:MFS transporter [Humidisolicoccus flavus]|uniref:MFS transporter n=1 Tax=Humidisolicoccus flavus TaxID=3111414 RepID=UPI003252644D